jgi:hypothetical protein
MKLPFEGTFRIAGTAAALHFVGACLTAAYVSVASESSGQAVMVWAVWALIDFPFSLLAYSLVDAHSWGEHSIFLAHAVLGTVWWFFLVAVAARLFQSFRKRVR